MARSSIPLRLTCVLVGLVPWMAIDSALADVAPPPGYVESCTVAAFQRPGLECQSCRAWHGDAQACSHSLGEQGYEHRCRTSGASAWDEVWCRPVGARAAPSAEPAPPAAAPPVAPSSPDPALMSSPEPATPVATIAAPAEPSPGEQSSGLASPGEGPSMGSPPPGARGCGSCEAGSDRASLSLVGLLVALAAALTGVALRRSPRGRSHRRP